MRTSSPRGIAALRWWLLADDLVRQPRRALTTLRSHWGTWRADRELGSSDATAGSPRALCVLIDHSFPTPMVDAGSDRLVRLARLIAAEGLDVVIMSVLGRKSARVAPDQDVEAIEPELEYDPRRFADTVASAELVILSRPKAAARLFPAVRALTRGFVVYDTVDMLFVRLQREASALGSRRARLRAHIVRSLETRLIDAIEGTAAISPEERTTLLDLCPTAEVFLLPIVHPRRVTPTPGPTGRQHLLFFGSFGHAPNVDAVAYLLDEVMPLVRATEPDLRLVVAGRGLPPSLQAALGDDYLGWVRDLDPVIDAARVMLAPIRYGAGMKGKMGRALAAGLPVVTTQIGAEGLGLIDGTTAMIREDARGLAAACIELARDDQRWAQLSDAGRAAVEAQFSPEVLATEVGALVSRARAVTAGR